MKAISFNEVRNLQFEMLIQVDRFCREHDIKYYLSYGTLLGAVRHKGFIPWDDDIDLMFPQPDLEKFCSLFYSERYKVVTADNDLVHNLVFPRLYDTKTFSYVGKYETWGVGIDLYGIYGLPTSPYKHKEYFEKFYKLWNNRRRLAGLRRKLALHGLWISNDLNFNLLNKSVKKGISLQKSFPFETSCVCMIDTRPAMPIPKSVLEKAVELDFEGRKFLAPIGYSELLTLMYGDYMQLPPVEQRVPYHGYDCYWKE